MAPSLAAGNLPANLQQGETALSAVETQPLHCAPASGVPGWPGCQLHSGGWIQEEDRGGCSR